MADRSKTKLEEALESVPLQLPAHVPLLDEVIDVQAESPSDWWALSGILILLAPLLCLIGLGAMYYFGFLFAAHLPPFGL